MQASVRLAGSARRFHHPAGDDPDHLGQLSPAQLAAPAAVTVHLSPTGRRGAGAVSVHDIGSVLRWASTAGLQVGAVDRSTARVELLASRGALAEAFGVSLEERRTVDWVGRALTYFDHRDELSIPAHLEGVVTAVLGLGTRPLGRPRLAVLPHDATVDMAYTPETLATVYNFPVLDNGGVGRRITVGIVELGGAVDGADLAEFCTRMPRLRVIEEGIDGSRPRSDPLGADTEVALDWQVVAGVLTACAPLADIEIVIKYAPNTDRGFSDATASFASDGRDYSAVSTSWGGPEEYWTPAAMDAMERAYQVCAARGTVHCVAAGDNGSTDGLLDGRQHADHPASAPHAVACGGTRLLAIAGQRVSETAWNELGVEQGATGGGVSGHFEPPHYQAAAGIVPLSANDGRPGRGVPDVSAVADPRTGYLVRRDGAEQVIGGTSAVAPLWAALLALTRADIGRPLGDVHPALYRASAGFHDIAAGGNGAYAAQPGWDATTGLGTPDGRALSAEIAATPPAVTAPAAALDSREHRGPSASQEARRRAQRHRTDVTSIAGRGLG